MRRRPVRRIGRNRDGTFTIELPDEERGLLEALVPQLREMLVDGTDPGLRRLFPTAYPDDAERDQEYAALTHDELLSKRLADLDTLEQHARAERLDEEQVTQWMGAINSLRLVLGTRLDVAEEMDEPDPDHPDAPAFAVYSYLSFLLENLIDAASN